MIAVELARLVQLTPRPVIERSRKCGARVLYDRVQDSEDGDYKYLEVISKAHCSGSEHSYLTVVRFDRFGLIKNPVRHPTWVRCSCPYFLYYVEVALSRHASSDVYYSNGRYPMIRNPRLIPYLCKHLIATVNPSVQRLQMRMREKESLLTKVKKKVPAILKELLQRGRRTTPESDIT